MTIYNVLFGFISNGITLGKGDFLNVSSGGVADSIVVGGHANLVVSSGGVTLGTEVNSKGTELVDAGGRASGSIVDPEGTEQVNPGGTITGTVVSGGNEYVSAGTADFTVLSAGNEYVYSGGAASGSVVSGKGKLFVFSAGTASGTILSGGYEYAFSAGVVSASLVESGGVVQVQTSGVALDSIVSSGGQETLLFGGVAKGEIVSGGGFDVVFGQASGAVVGGGQNVYPGGMASASVVASGGIQLISAGAVANGTIVNDGGQQVILAGGVANETVLSAGGTIDLPDLAFSAGGTAVLDPLSDVLTVTEGFASYQERLAGIYEVGSFEALQDSGSGTAITLITITGSEPPAPRTLEWAGGSAANFGDAADWIDTSDELNPAATAPAPGDTAEFLTGGGPITGIGSVGSLRFGGSTSWNVTSGASLSAEAGVVVGQSGDNGLLINDGASVNGLGLSDDISGAPTGAAAVTVDGAGSAWHSAGELVVGDLGTGMLTVTGAADVNATALGTLPAMALGAGGGGIGSLLVTGAGSWATLTGQFDVGQAGDGTLTVADQGTVQTGNDPALDPTEGLDIAQLVGGTGTATVTGIGSLLSNTGRFIVGDAGVGSLSITAGATVTTTPDVDGVGLTIANASGASGSSVNVSGAGSDLAVTGTLVVGASGFGSLSLSQGATVTAASLDVAAAASGDGAISIAGTGTTLDIAGSLTLGDQAAGELSILGGAQMTIAGGEIGGTGIDGTGNLDIEDAGSTLTINGGTLLVGANGPAEFTLGIGGTLDGEVSTEPNGVTNLYGNVDPATLLNDGAENIGNSQGGTSQSDDFYIANSGTITIKGTATFYTPLVTFETAAADTSTTGLWVIAAKDTLVMNAASADASQTFDFTSATAAELVIGQVPSGPNINNLDTMVQNGTTMTTPLLTNSPVLGASALGTWAAPIENYTSGDVIVLRGLTYGSANAVGDVVTVWSEAGDAGSMLGTLTFVDKSGNPSSADATAAAVQINALACFAAGTRIETVDGLVAVERLAVGDRVRTVLGGVGSAGSGWDWVQGDTERAGLGGLGYVHSSREWVQGDAERTGLGGPGRGEAGADQYEPIVWVGSRAVDCARHPRPETVWPVRVRAGAFGENVPVCDLYLSPDHAVYVDGVLVPVKLLVNGTTVRQVKRKHVVYYHVELEQHDVVLAEGLPAETYLDTGDRAKFSGERIITLHPDFAARPDAAMTWETKGAAPLVMTGPKLATARAMIAQTRAIEWHNPACTRRKNGERAAARPAASGVRGERR